jgi:hypothetical protein
MSVLFPVLTDRKEAVLLRVVHLALASSVCRKIGGRHCDIMNFLGSWLRRRHTINTANDVYSLFDGATAFVAGLALVFSMVGV